MRTIISILLTATMMISLAVNVLATEQPDIQLITPVHIFADMKETAIENGTSYDKYNWLSHGECMLMLNGCEIGGSMQEALAMEGYSITCTDSMSATTPWIVPEGEYAKTIELDDDTFSYGIMESEVQEPPVTEPPVTEPPATETLASKGF